MQHLIVSGRLPCTKDECATLAAINLRIYELNYIKMIEEEEEKKLQRKNEKRMSSQKSEALAENRNKSAALNPLAGLVSSRSAEASNLNESYIPKPFDHKIIEEDENVSEEPSLHATTPIAEAKYTDSGETVSNNGGLAETKDRSVDTKDQQDLPPSPNLTETGDKPKTEAANQVMSKSNEQLSNMNLLVLTNGGWESFVIYLKTCSCVSNIHNSSRFITLNKLIAPNYQRSNDMMKLIKVKKERLVKTSFYNDEMKLKEYYLTMCRSLHCFGCMLFTVQEILFDLSDAAMAAGKVSFKKVKRLLAIKPNKILLIDYKTKTLAKSQRMTDLKSWYSGDGYYNLTPMFLLNNNNNNQDANNNHNPSSLSSNSTSPFPNNNNSSSCHQSTGNIFSHLFKLATSSSNNSIDMNKLFVIEFKNDYKWHMQIDDFHSLKSITCILLDQSLDMGIDNNPLMLDLTISEHFQNRYKLFAPPGTAPTSNANSDRNNSVRNHHYYTKKQRQAAAAQSIIPLPLADGMKKSIAISSNSGQSKSVIAKSSDMFQAASAITAIGNNASPSVSFMVGQRNQSLMGIDSEANSEANQNGSFSVIGAFDRHNRAGGGGSRQAPMHSLFSSYNGGQGGNGGLFSNNKPQVTYKYEQEFQELQFILLWFPEEVALRLTEVEYELFKQIPPMEYLRHATLDMNNFKTVATDTNKTRVVNNSSDKHSASESLTDSSNGNSSSSNQPSIKCVQDLIIRYKEVKNLE